MNCAHHADASAVAYCRTCGKALCANCTRPVRGVIYCEECLGARMEGSLPAAGFVPGTVPPVGAVPPPVLPPMAPAPGASGPNPTVAGILAGVFPFGVGAVYTGQYAKGLAHLAIFGLLIAGVSASDHGGGEWLGPLCGLGIAFFVVYQIFDAVRSARAIQAGLPAPDPYGLAASFGGGTRVDASKVPMGAIVLILLGVLFLLHTLGWTEFGFDRFWPLLLIFLGGWLFARNYGLLGPQGLADARACRQRLIWPAILFTVGVLCLLKNLNGPSLHRTWPLILLVAGGVKLFQGTGTAGMGPGANPPCGGVIPPGGPSAPPPPAPPTPGEVNRG